MSLIDPCLNIPTRGSAPQDWVEWHKTLKSRLGSRGANAVWVQVWGKRGSNEANTRDLREYMIKQGVTIDKSAWDSFVDVTGDIGDFIGGTFTTTKWVILGVVGLGGLAVVILIFQIVLQPFKAASVASEFAGGGVAKKALGGGNKMLTK